MNVSLYHISGKDNKILDFLSRHRIGCTNENCQMYKFLSVESEITVELLNTEDIISGNFKMPFTNHVSWKSLKGRQ